MKTPSFLLAQKVLAVRGTVETTQKQGCSEAQEQIIRPLRLRETSEGLWHELSHLEAMRCECPKLPVISRSCPTAKMSESGSRVLQPNPSKGFQTIHLATEGKATRSDWQSQIPVSDYKPGSRGTYFQLEEEF